MIGNWQYVSLAPAFQAGKYVEHIRHRSLHLWKSHYRQSF